ncbi:MAG: helix-turn-helix domain-containing protein [Deltaproteobacteria bacterium]|nr:helix-turn-helix domain-containing protein [Deltaproteobacteria bacterium]
MQSTRETIAKNFVERYGADGLARLLDALDRGESGQRIAEEFQVSRERVRQWKNSFGRVVTLYEVFPEVAALVQPPAAPARATSGEEEVLSISLGGIDLVEDL